MSAILVTGGCGFIGSHLVDALAAEGREVVVVDDLSTGRLQNLNRGAVFYPGDVADRALVAKIFRQHRIGAVVHQAAKINLSVATEQPHEDVRSSVSGTIALLDASVAAGVGRFLYASSVAVYGRPDRMPVDEDSRPTPIYSYGIAKYCAEEYVRFYGANRGLPHHVLRYGNVYGPRQPIFGEVGVIAIFTEKARNGEPFVIFGDGQHTRDFLYVEDAVEATLRLLSLPGSETLNVATGRSRTVNEVHAAFEEALGRPVPTVRRPERLGEIGHFACSAARLGGRLGWAPRIELADGIRRTLDEAA